MTNVALGRLSPRYRQPTMEAVVTMGNGGYDQLVYCDVARPGNRGFSPGLMTILRRCDGGYWGVSGLVAILRLNTLSAILVEYCRIFRKSYTSISNRGAMVTNSSHANSTKSKNRTRRSISSSWRSTSLTSI